MPDTISPQALQAEITAGASVDLIDVRSPAEFGQVHAIGARNVPLDRFDAGAVLAAHDVQIDRPLYLICHSGARASQAAEKLAAAGCEQAIVVEGGTLAWDRAGLPVNRSGKRGMNVQRQTQLTIGLGVLAGALLAQFIDPRFIWLSAFFGAGLSMAGITGACPLASLIAAMPWNKGDCSSCVLPNSTNSTNTSTSKGGGA